MSLAAVTVGTTVLQTGMSLLAQRGASKAADQEVKYRNQLLERRAASERLALKENTSRQLKERDRRMAEVRVSQAARGFAVSGTALAVVGEIGSRLDDRIDQMTEQGLDRVAQYGEQVKANKFARRMQQSAEKTQMFGTALGGFAKAATQGYKAYNLGGTQPFSIFA